MWWLCGCCGYAWQATVGNRVARGSGCPACAIERRARGRSRVPRERTLAVNRAADLARELHPSRNRGLDVETMAVFSMKKVWWLCSVCGHEWETTPANRSRGGTGCPTCWAKRRGDVAQRVSYERSLSAQHPVVAELARNRNPGIDPSRLGTKSDQRLWWRCKRCGHAWVARVADRSAGTGCPACIRDSIRRTTGNGSA